ncbi:MAG: TetR/AcrR family transcriptional regulator [Myxococcota bacterium]
MPTTAVSGTEAGARRRRGAETADRILDVAEQLFAERGYAGTSLREVAECVGVRIPSLYNHFSSKELLYAAVLERGIGPLLAMLSRFVSTGPAGGADPPRVMREVMRWLVQHPALPRLVLHETLSGGQRLTPMLRRWIAPTFARAQELVEVSPAARRWKAEQIPLLVIAMYHVVVGYFAIAPLYEELGGHDLMAAEAVERQTRFLCDLVGALFELPPEPERNA